MNKLKSFKKSIDDVREGKETALEASKKELSMIPEIPALGKLCIIIFILPTATLSFLKSLTLSYNKIQGTPILGNHFIYRNS